MTRTLHPQAVPGQPSAVRWVVHVDLPVGRVISAPGTVGPMLEYGVLAKMFVDRGGVWTWLDEGRTWTEHGPRIRDALAAAVDLPGWEIEEGSDELLGLIARDILEGELAGYVASHGGIITVAAVKDDRLALDFGGACEDCPAAGTTLHERIEAAVRERYPRLAGVDRVGGGHPHVSGWLGLPMPGRGR